MSIIVAMVILSSPGGPSLDEMKKFLPEGTRITVEDTVTSFELDGSTIDCGAIGAPIPLEELSGPMETSRFWQSSNELIENHKAHLIVTAHGNNDKKELASRLTEALSVILKSTDSVGVYWGSGTILTQKDIFISISDNTPEDAFPLYLWLDFRMFSESDGKISLFTTGMKEFGLMEVEIKDSEETYDDVFDIAFNLSHYLMDYGPVLNDGDTFGMSATQKLKISHTKSFVDREETVLRIKL